MQTKTDPDMQVVFHGYTMNKPAVVMLAGPLIICIHVGC